MYLIAGRNNGTGKNSSCNLYYMWGYNDKISVMFQITGLKLVLLWMSDCGSLKITDSQSKNPSITLLSKINARE